APLARRNLRLRDEDLIVRGGARSALGKLLRSSRGTRTPQERRGRPLWPNPQAVRALTTRELDTLIEALLQAAVTHGLVSEEATPFGDQPGFRLNDGCVLFKRGMPEEDDRRGSENRFFRELYTTLAIMLVRPGHPLFDFEAREHTAQVDGERRAVREKRFRFGPRERGDLSSEEARLREIGEANRFLPVLFCSPTMELGVDISALNAVYL